VLKERLQDLYWRTFPYFLFNVYRAYRAGEAIPVPRKLKLATVRDYAQKYGLQVLVETGTYRGDMIADTMDLFSHLYSIELSPGLANTAQRRFAEYPRVTIEYGDSAEALPRILSEINEPCLFWLDAHYSAGITAHGKLVSPILQELDCILSHPIKNHVILIDDAREFSGRKGYPTMEEVIDLVAGKRPELRIIAYNDIIRVWMPMAKRSP
jgi:hypothetical protein